MLGTFRKMQTPSLMLILGITALTFICSVGPTESSGVSGNFDGIKVDRRDLDIAEMNEYVKEISPLGQPAFQFHSPVWRDHPTLSQTMIALLVSKSTDLECQAIGLDLNAQALSNEGFDLSDQKPHDVKANLILQTQRAYQQIVEDHLLVSLPEMYDAWVRETRHVTADVVAVPVELMRATFKKEDLTEEEIQSHYDRYKTQTPGTDPHKGYTEDGVPAWGYQTAAKADFSFLIARNKTFALSIKGQPQDLRDYYDNNRFEWIVDSESAEPTDIRFQPFHEVRKEVEKMWRDEQAQRQASKAMAALARKLYELGDQSKTVDMKALAQELGLEYKSITQIKRNQLDDIPGLGNVRSLSNLYDSEAGTLSSNRVEFEGGFLYARVENITPGVSLPLEEIKDEVVADVITAKAWDSFLDRCNQHIQMQAGQDLDDVASSLVKVLKAEPGNTKSLAGADRRPDAPFKKLLKPFRAYDITMSHTDVFGRDSGSIAQYIHSYVKADQLYARPDRGQGVVYIIRGVAVEDDKEFPFIDNIASIRRARRGQLTQQFRSPGFQNMLRMSDRDKEIFDRHIELR